MRSYIKDYPRPQLVRTDWENLNGTWDFMFDDANAGECEKWYCEFPSGPKQIRVPFTYETKLSGIGDEAHHENVWYSRTWSVTEEELESKKAILHFEGSDFITKVWVNGTFIGSHRGGYARFSFDITKAVRSGENTITVKAEDSLSIEQPRGKQRWLDHNYDCWYVQSTGIWKTVWMELVPEVYISSLKMTPNMSDGTLEVIAHIAGDLKGELELEAEVTFEDELINRSVKAVMEDKVKDVIPVHTTRMRAWAWTIHCWSPSNPQLYDISFRLKQDGEVKDTVLSYFGMREIRIEDGNILLNGSRLYQRLLLDQGYWADSLITPPSEEALIDDIEKIQALGFNGVRKHMKVEDERFVYWCDVKGLLLWSEMAAAYEFSDAAVEEFTKEWMEVIHQNYNHPSIITWTPFNESWGIPRVKTSKEEQRFTEAIYYLTKSYDPMRPVILNDGWEHTCSDIITLHDYEPSGDVFYERFCHLDELMSSKHYFNSDYKSAIANGYEYKGQPIIISEYGGIAFTNGAEGSWGYGRT